MYRAPLTRTDPASLSQRSCLRNRRERRGAPGREPPGQPTRPIILNSASSEDSPDHHHLCLKICLELNLWVTTWASPCLSRPAGPLLTTAASVLPWMAVSAAPWPPCPTRCPTPACPSPPPSCAPQGPEPGHDGSATEPLSWPVLVPASQAHLLVSTLTYLRTMSLSEIILFHYWSAPWRPETPQVGRSVPPASGSMLGPSTQSSSSLLGCALIHVAALISSLIN